MGTAAKLEGTSTPEAPVGSPGDPAGPIWVRIRTLSDSVRATAPEVAEAIELYSPYLRSEIDDDRRTLRNAASESGQAGELLVCEEKASADAAHLVTRSDQLFDDMRGSQLRRYRTMLEDSLRRTLLCAYGSILLERTMGPEVPKAAHNVVLDVIDAQAADERFWRLEVTQAVRESAARLGDDELSLLAAPIDPDRRARHRMRFLEAFWWSSALVMAEGAGTPRRDEVLGPRPSLGPTVVEGAIDAVAAAAVAAALDGRHEQLAASLLGPWRAVVS